MNVEDFTYLLQAPEKVTTPVQTHQLEDVIAAYPYFQAARALHLKGLKNLNSFKYNDALKMTAASTADREVLFDFITSDLFLQNRIANALSGKSDTLLDQEIEEEVVPYEESPKTALIEANDDLPLPRTARDAETILNPDLFKSKDPEVDKSIEKAKKEAEATLELGKPLEFTRKEKHSFTEWLQLTSFKSVPNKEVKAKQTPDPIKKETTRKKKNFELIDKFIESNPKIVPDPESTEKVDIKESLKIDKKELMTETLARVYLEQKKYKKAVQAYRILSLKYPEKSSFFADRIKAVEKIQKEQAKKE